jgi:hypothetical protein
MEKKFGAFYMMYSFTALKILTKDIAHGLQETKVSRTNYKAQKNR